MPRTLSGNRCARWCRFSLGKSHGKADCRGKAQRALGWKESIRTDLSEGYSGPQPRAHSGVMGFRLLIGK